MAGKLILLSGPSGAGKSTIARHLTEKKEFNLGFSVSACSRRKRKDEVDGKDYYFLTIDEFKSKIDDGEFLEWEEVYPSQYYGTLKMEVEKLRSLGKNVILDVDVMGGVNIKRLYKNDLLAIFIQPPTLEELEKRLRDRNTESVENVAKRVRKAKMEISYARKFDHIIVNENLEDAFRDADKVVESFLKT